MSIRVFLMVWTLLLSWPAKATELRFVTGEFLSFDFSSKEADSGAKPPVARGPFVETVQAVCARIHFDCPIGLVPWRRSLAMLEQGRPMPSSPSFPPTSGRSIYASVRC
ncbi:hypothetical protein ACFSHR_24105 [Azotobacter chroococcum]